MHMVLLIYFLGALRNLVTLYKTFEHLWENKENGDASGSF